jgi:hypothetical protein
MQPQGESSKRTGAPVGAKGARVRSALFYGSKWSRDVACQDSRAIAPHRGRLDTYRSPRRRQSQAGSRKRHPRAGSKAAPRPSSLAKRTPTPQRPTALSRNALAERGRGRAQIASIKPTARYYFLILRAAKNLRN